MIIFYIKNSYFQYNSSPVQCHEFFSIKRRLHKLNLLNYNRCWWILSIWKRRKKMKIIPLKICLIWNRLTFVKISEGLKSSNIRATQSIHKNVLMYQLFRKIFLVVGISTIHFDTSFQTQTRRKNLKFKNCDVTCLWLDDWRRRAAELLWVRNANFRLMFTKPLIIGLTWPLSSGSVWPNLTQPSSDPEICDPELSAVSVSRILSLFSVQGWEWPRRITRKDHYQGNNACLLGWHSAPK